MPASNRRREPGRLSAEQVMGLAVLAAAALAAGVVWVVMHLGHRLAATGTHVPGDPFGVLFGLAGGTLAWPGSPGWWVLGGLLAVLTALSVGAGMLVRRVRRRRTRVDHTAAYLGRGRDIEALTGKNAADTATRLGVTASPGVLIGRTVAGDRPLYGSWEDMHLDIWGPRQGKSMSRAIPAILDAPGPVLATSNKRDLVDATRDPRATAGTVWVFDPQAIAAEPATWWWNPLSYVTNEVRAAKLAGHFAAATSTGGNNSGHFEDNGRDLLAGCFLAAALAKRPITDVYTWLTRPGETEPAEIVRAGGYPLTADQLAGIARTPDKERGSIYSTARRMATCLTYKHVAAWITDTSGERPEFDPAAFARSRDTLFSLSKEGTGSAGPLVLALTAAVAEAAEDHATTSPGGRLPVPLLGVLDEAANVCRWKELPDLYSHYGSRGIVLLTILQSWSQGVEVWGDTGMKKLWASANIKVYGGNVAENDFLEMLSKVLGDHDHQVVSVSHGRGGRTVSRQLRRDRILDVADLAALPKGRALVFAAGVRPTLARTLPWTTSPHATAVRASIAAHDPCAADTLADAEHAAQASAQQADTQEKEAG